MDDTGEDAGVKLHNDPKMLATTQGVLVKKLSTEIDDAGEIVYLHAPGIKADDPQMLAATGGALKLSGGVTDLADLGFEVTDVLISFLHTCGWVPYSGADWWRFGFGTFLTGPYHVRVRDLKPGQRLQQQKGAALDLDRLARAFRYEFRNPTNVETLFDALSSICDTDNSYARAAGIFQSSGWGKSRTVCELWRHEVWVIYFSFASGTGYPTAASIKDWFLQKADQCLKKPFMLGQLECMTLSLAYFVACLRELSSLIREEGLTKQAFSARLSTGLEGAKEFWDHVQQKMVQLLDEYKGLPTIAARYEKPSDAWAKWASDASSILGGAIADFKQDQQRFSVLFVDDEARHLLNKDTGNPHLNSFIPIRRSAQAMSAHGVGMLLFMDTSSQVSSFADKVWADPSDRVAKGALNLAPPIWASFSADASQEDWQLFFSAARMFQDIIRPEWYVRYGRPLWWVQFRSYMEGSDSKGAFRLVHSFARDKLLGGGGAWNNFFAHGNEKKKLSTEAALSLLGVRVAFDVDPRPLAWWLIISSLLYLFPHLENIYGLHGTCL